MTSTTELKKPQIGEVEILDIIIDLMFDGHSISECRAYVLDEYHVDICELESLLVQAQRQVRACEMAMYRQLRF